MTDSNSNNDWEMVGKDIKKLQELINSLEQVKKEEDKKKAELEKSNTTVNTNSIVDTVNITNNKINNTTSE